MVNRRRMVDKLRKINETLLNLGADHRWNVNLLTALCGELLGATCALYNRLSDGMLCAKGRWHTPADFKPEDKPEGHICYDVIQRSTDETFLVRNLQGSKYAKTDPNVAAYGLQTYFGKAVRCDGEHIGTLCAVFTKDIEPTEDEEQILSIIASALGSEEERKRVEEKITAAAKEWQLTFDTMADGISLQNKDYEITNVNLALCNILGKDKKELIGKKCYEIFHNTNKPLDGCPFEKAKSSNRKEEIEIFEPFLNSWLSVSVSPVVDEQGEVVQCVHVVRNIVERKRAEQSRSQLLAILEATTDFVGFADARDGHILHINKAGRHMCGIGEAEDVTKLKIADVHPDRSYRQLQEEIIPIAQREGVWTGECAFRHRDGREIPVLMVLMAHKSVNGEVEIFSTISRDITGRKQMEEKMRESELKFRAIFDAAIDGILCADIETKKLVFGNEAICRMLGYSPEEIGTISVSDIHPKEKLPKIMADFEKQVAEKIEITKDAAVKRKDGTIFYADINAAPITLAGKRYLIGIFRDVTERRKVEARQAELLEKINGINKELQSFAYVVSHDLKVPLRGISTLAEWLVADCSDKLGAEGKEQLEMLNKKVMRMHSLIDGVLQYSRIERTREELVKVDLNELVPEIVETISPPPHVSITIEGQLPVIETERTRITQVFQNLLSNAVKYMDKPKGEIKVGCTNANDFWKFSISDNGPGIEERHFERIFQIFQTLQTRDDFESTGIGLTIVKKIVEMHGGKIWLESTPSKGTTFFFTAPKNNKNWITEQVSFTANGVSKTAV